MATPSASATSLCPCRIGNFNQTNGQADFVENGSTGQLSAVYTPNPTDTTTAPVSVSATSDDAGATWTAALPVATYPANTGDVYGVGTDTLSVATGDSGFTGLLIRTGTAADSSVPDRPIYADGLPGNGTGGSGGGGTRAAVVPAEAGPGGGTGGGTGGGGTGGGGTGTPPAPIGDTCKIKQFGPLDILADACLEVDPASGAVTAHGHVKVSGLDLAGASIRFDARARTVTSTGPVTFSVGGTELFRAPIDWKLPHGQHLHPAVDRRQRPRGQARGLPRQGLG